MAEKKPRPPVPKKPKVIGVDKPYGMTLPRLGNTIIINNVSRSMPGSEADVKRLKEAYETVGFDVFVYKDCTTQELKRINKWMVSKETHQYCNAFSLIIIGRGTDAGDLLNSDGGKFHTIEELTDQLTGIPTLDGKPKIVLILGCVKDGVEAVNAITLPKRKDLFLGYSFFDGHRTKEFGSEYLQAYAKYLEKEFKDRSMQTIFGLVNKVMEQKAALTNDVLMEVARNVAARHMESLALAELGLDETTVTNIKDSRVTDKIMFSFDILCIWRNMSEEHTKQKLARLMSDSGEKYGNINPDRLKNILKKETQTNRQNCMEVNGFRQVLHLGDFHVAERMKIRQLEDEIKQLELNTGNEKQKYESDLKILREKLDYLRLTEEEKRRQLEERLNREKKESMRDSEERLRALEKERENYYDYHQKEMNRIKKQNSIEKERAIKEERQKLMSFQHEKIKHEEELKDRIKILEIEKRTNQQYQRSEDKKKIQALEGALAKIKDDKVKFEEEMRTIRQEMKNEKTRQMEAEVRMIRSLEETVELSTQRLISLKTNEIKPETSQVIVATEETIPGDIPAQEGERCSDLSQKFQVLKEKAATAEFEAKLTQSEKEKQQLEDEIRKVRLNEKRTKEELERKLMEKENELKNVTAVNENIKQSYENNISTLENQLQDKDVKIKRLTEEKVNTDEMHRKTFKKVVTEKEILRERLRKTEEEKVPKLEDHIRNADQRIETLMQEKIVSDKALTKEKDKTRRLEQSIKAVYHQVKMFTEEKPCYEPIYENLDVFVETIDSVSPTDIKDQLDRYKKKIEHEAEVKQKEALTKQSIAQQEERNRLLAEQTTKYEDLKKVMTEKYMAMEKMKEAADEKIRNLEVQLTKAFKQIKLGHISSHDVNVMDTLDMTVMRETGMIVVSTVVGFLCPLSLQDGRFIKKRIEHPCQHIVPVYVLCVQVAGREYLALSCDMCRDIKLMNLNNQKGNRSKSQLMQHEVITAFSSKKVYRMCHGEKNRLFVDAGGVVLELDTSTTTFTEVRTINTCYSSYYIGLCYVPYPSRLLVVSHEDKVRALSCDDNTLVWRVKKDDDLDPGPLLYIPSHNAILVADWYKNRVVVLNSGTGLKIQSIQLPDYMSSIRHLGLCNDQIIVKSEGDREHISYFSVKQILM